MGRYFWVLFLGWAVAFFGAFVAFYVTPADDFGLAAGWNKVGVFMGRLGAAGALAGMTTPAALRAPRGARLRWLGWIPAAALLLLLVAFTALILWANFQRTPPEGGPPPGPVTAPAPVSPEAEPALPVSGQ